MTLPLHYPSNFQKFSLILILTGLVGFMYGQGLYVGPNTEFHLGKDLAFSTSNTVVDMDATATFSMEAETMWGSSQEYVNGKITVYGTGETTLPVGDNGVYAPVTMTHSTEVSALYSNSAPSSGTNGTDVDAVGTEEFWELTGNAIVTLPWNEASDMTNLVNNNGGSLNAVSIVGLDNGVWNLISDSQSFTVNGDLLNGEVGSDPNNSVNLNGFGQITFGIDHQVVLSVNDLFLSASIDLISNPVRQGDPDIRFKTTGDVLNMKASLYDLHGRLLKEYHNVEISAGEGNLSKANLKSGLYFVKFEQEGKQGVKKLIVE